MLKHNMPNLHSKRRGGGGERGRGDGGGNREKGNGEKVTEDENSLHFESLE